MTRPSLASIEQDRARAARTGKCVDDAVVASHVPAMSAAIRDALAVAAPHTEWRARREAKYGRAESCVCDICKIVRAITAHIDTTPKEKP